MQIAHDVATCMHYTGVDPFSKQAVDVAKGLKDRKMQRALMRFFKPENYFEVRKALTEASRTDLIGAGCDALIPANPPKEAIEARHRRANQAAWSEEKEGDHYHTPANPAKGEPAGERGLNRGYRPGRKSQKSQKSRKKRK
jgi:Domain of unknown function (DUF3362)